MAVTSTATMQPRPLAARTRQAMVPWREGGTGATRNRHVRLLPAVDRPIVSTAGWDVGAA